MPQEQALLPYINQAYGTPVQAPDMSTFQDTFTRDSEMKRQEYKNATQIGLDLDAESRKHIMGKMEDMLGKAASGELMVNSDEWMRETGELMASASQLKQAEQLRKEYQEQFLANPDQMTFMETNEIGEMVDTGLDGFLRANQELMKGEYESPFELVQKQSEIMQRAQPLPVGVQEGIANLRKDTINASKMLIQAGEGEVKPVSVSRGNVTFEIQTNADEGEVNAMVDTLIAEHGGSLAAQFRRTGGSGTHKMDEETFVLENIKDMMITAQRDYQVRGDFSSRYGGGSGSKKSPRVEEFQTDMKAAIENLEVDQVLKYVSGAGFNGEIVNIDGNPYFRFFKSGVSASGAETKQNVVDVPLEMRALEDFVVQNSKQIDRESLDAFEPPAVDLTKKQATIDQGKEGRVDSLATKWAENTKSKARRKEINSLKDFLNVDWIGIDEGLINDDIIVDGKKYRDVNKAIEAIKEKMREGKPAATEYKGVPTGGF